MFIFIIIIFIFINIIMVIQSLLNPANGLSSLGSSLILLLISFSLGTSTSSLSPSFSLSPVLSLFLSPLYDTALYIVLVVLLFFSLGICKSNCMENQVESGRGCNWGGGVWQMGWPKRLFFARDSSKLEYKLEREANSGCNWDGIANRERERHSWTAERRRQSDLFGGATQHVSD